MINCLEYYAGKHDLGGCEKCSSLTMHPAPPTDLNLQELNMTGVKHDGGKPKLGLVHKAFMWALATTLTKGAAKYSKYNWLGGMDWDRPYDALLRHLTAWWDGESNDAESGDSHLWHAAAELMFLVVYEVLGLGKDTRYIPAPKKREFTEENIRTIQG